MKERLRRSMKGVIANHSSIVGSLVAVATTEPLVVLTYDDGPDPAGTEGILAALANYGATATFFVLLTRVTRYPELLAKIVSEGHEVGLHGPDHRLLTSFSYREIRARTAVSKSELEIATGQQVKWFRPPYGAQTLQSWLAVRATGLTSVMWGATSWDWKDLPQTDQLAKATQGIQRGTILLSHDGHASVEDGAKYEPPQPRVDRGELANRILNRLADMGLSGCSLSASLHSGTAVKAASFHR